MAGVWKRSRILKYRGCIIRRTTTTMATTTTRRAVLGNRKDLSDGVCGMKRGGGVAPATVEAHHSLATVQSSLKVGHNMTESPRWDGYGQPMNRDGHGQTTGGRRRKIKYKKKWQRRKRKRIEIKERQRQKSEEMEGHSAYFQKHKGIVRNFNKSRANNQISKTGGLNIWFQNWG